MAATFKGGAAGYDFDSMNDISSHASGLFNQRMAILFFKLDLESVDLNSTYDIERIQRVKALIYQIYKNVQPMVRNNPVMRATLNLDTHDRGINVIDVMFSLVNAMITQAESTGWDKRKVYILVNELNEIEVAIRGVLQYFKYFIKPDFSQKPDIHLATESYKSMADKFTVEQLKTVVGKNNKVDFDALSYVNQDEIGDTDVESFDMVEEDEVAIE